MPHADEVIAASLLEQQEQSQLMPHADDRSLLSLPPRATGTVSTNASC